MAEHASVADSDVDIGSHAGTLDLTGVDAVNHPDRGDRQRSFNGPMVHQNKGTVVGYVILGTLFAVAIGLSANSMKTSNEALQLAENNAKAIDTANQKMIAVETDMIDAVTGFQPQPPAPPQPQQPDLTTPAELVPVTTPPPTPPPTSPRPTEPHPLDPQWIQTSHEHYQEMADSYEENGSDIHSYRIAQQTCGRQGRVLCGYETYCPNGQGSPPYGGGPPYVHNYDSLEETQWAPYQHGNDEPLENDPARSSWVQIGKMDEASGGKEGNDFVECWKFGDWFAGSGDDIEDGWGEEHRVWMLCCEKEPVDVVAAPTPAADATAPETATKDRNPKWIQTTDDDYQYYDEADPQAHSYRIAQATCQRQGGILCDYEEYCPNGQGNDPFNGGPQSFNSDSLEETQWAPFQMRDEGYSSDPAFTEWVQIGTLSEANGGKEENDYVKCWEFNDYYQGAKDDVEEEWGDEHRMWILCCETKDDASPVEAPTPAEVAPPAEPTVSVDTPPGLHPLRPRWIQTTHDDYEMFEDSMGPEGHSYRVATNTCGKQGLKLCDYSVYCPNGPGEEVFEGGPQAYNSDTLEDTQWAPYAQEQGKGFSNDPAWSEWVQIGNLLDKDGGSEENNFAKCYKFDDWYTGTDLMNIEKEWEGKHTMWMLCCEPDPVDAPPAAVTSTDPDSHPLNPQWYQTTHEIYLDTEQHNEENDIQEHSYRTAQTTCQREQLQLCAYEVYCPGGRGTDPFASGPPSDISNGLHPTQWAPYARDYDKPFSSDPAMSEWVQIGKMTEADGGDEENDFVQCYKFDDWYQGNEDDVEDVWGEEHTMWILCCEKAVETTEPELPAPTEPATEPTEEEHPLNPEWFQTTHEDYQELLDINDTYNNTFHAHSNAWALCSMQDDKTLCPYETYCPDGQGGAVYGNGPPDLYNSENLDANQWAPYWVKNPSDDAAESSWVQIGEMSSEDGGTDENDFLKCWKYDDWYAGDGVDIVERWAEEHTMWILCCDNNPLYLVPPPAEPSATDPESAEDEYPLNPEWYQTTHEDYQDQLDVYETINATNHPYTTAWIHCGRLEKKLCPLQSYCPGGQGGATFDGGPPDLYNAASLDANQWAPYWVDGADESYIGSSWVQVGEMSSNDGGTAENDFLKCWTYDDWYAGDGIDIEERWGEENTMWFLCCDDFEATDLAALPVPTDSTATAPAPGPTGRNPEWFQTTHQDYQDTVAINDQYNITWHSHAIAWGLCGKQDDKTLCPYEEYCPSGQGGSPFDGGPPKLHNHASLHENQWAPFWIADDYEEEQKTSWVQVGIMPASDGGKDENDFLQCWKYDDWYAGDGEDIEEKWLDEHRVWILCCDKEEI